MTAIGSSAFKDCRGLTSITIPDGVTSIGGSAFNGCSGLTSITIPDSVTFIGFHAFWSCYNLKSVFINDIATWCNISFLDNPLFYAENMYLKGTLVTDLVIPDGVTSIGEGAFNGCGGLTSVTISDSVTSIGEYAFQMCYGLTSVTIGKGVTSIYFGAFKDCNSLKSVTFKNTSVWYIADSHTATIGTTIASSDLSDPATAATYLTSTYLYYYWRRN